MTASYGLCCWCTYDGYRTPLVTDANTNLEDAQKRLVELTDQNKALSDALSMVPKEKRGYAETVGSEDCEVIAEEGGPLLVSGGETIRYALYLRTRRELNENDYAQLVVGDWALSRHPQEFTGEIPIPISSDNGGYGDYKPIRLRTSLPRDQWELAISVHSHRLWDP